MVVFVDLDGDDEKLQDIQHSLTHHAITSQHLQKLRIRDGQSQYQQDDDGGSDTCNINQAEIVERGNPNINSFSAALSCYP